MAEPSADDLEPQISEPNAENYSSDSPSNPSGPDEPIRIQDAIRLLGVPRDLVRNWSREGSELVAATSDLSNSRHDRLFSRDEFWLLAELAQRHDAGAALDALKEFALRYRAGMIEPLTDPTVIGAKVLRRLIEAINEIADSMRSRSMDSTARVAVHKLERLVPCESASIMAMEGDRHGTLRLLEETNEKVLASSKEKWELHDQPRGGLTGHLAFKGQSANLSWLELNSEKIMRYVSGKPLDFLPSNRCDSLLFIPLIFHDSFLGCIKLNNRRATDHSIGRPMRFSTYDQGLIELLARPLAATLRTMRLARFEDWLVSKIAHFQTVTATISTDYLHRFLAEVLIELRWVLPADGVNLSYRRSSLEPLCIIAAAGASQPETLPVLLSGVSLGSTVLLANRPLSIDNVDDDLAGAGYVKLWSAAKSVVAAPGFVSPERPQIVLFAESRRSSHFDRPEEILLLQFTRTMMLSQRLMDALGILLPQAG
jgi:hypothetical protein